MDTCKKCSNKFKPKEVIKSIWLHGYKPIICDECNTKHYVNTSTRLIVAFSIGGPLILFNLRTLIYIYGRYSLLVYFIWLIFVIILTPYFARYHIKNEEQNDDTKTLLVSNLDYIKADIIISILESYEVPYLKISKGIGGAMEIFAGSNTYGIDIYVQPHMLQFAKDLINTDNNEDNILE